jgi:predicted nucleic acid-binding protein
VQETEAAITAGWLEVTPLQNPEAAQRLQAAFFLGDGKSEVLTLAQERGAALVLIDEEQGSRRAEAMGFPVLRTVGILLQAKASGLIAAVKESLDALRAEGFRLSDEAYREALRKAGEGP